MTARQTLLPMSSVDPSVVAVKFNPHFGVNGEVNWIGGRLLFVIFVALWCCNVQAQNRLALVVGNADYRHAGNLANPVNDAALIEAALRNTGFNVRSVRNASKDVLLAEMLAFSRSLRQSNTVGLFYFAGHGLQLNGENYLVPVDADIASEQEIKIAGVSLNDFLATLSSEGQRSGGMNIVILDACRNNPFARSWRSVSRGLAPVDSPSGTLIAYATAPGQVASDGAGGNSPYAKALANAIQIPGQPIEQTFKATRSAVRAATAREGRVQEPWETTSLTTDFYFIPQSVQAPAPAAAPAPKPVAPATVAALNANNGCVRVGARLVAPLQVQPGTRICAENSDDEAIIKGVTGRAVIYSVNGGYEISCLRTELCGFNWPAGPVFKVRLETSSDGATSASLVAPKN